MDGLIGRDDVREVLKIMIGNEVEKYSLKSEDLDRIADQVVAEADMDNTGYLGFSEFKKIMGRCPEFEG